MENVTQHKALAERRLEAIRFPANAVGAAAAVLVTLGLGDTAVGQGAGGFLQPTITADYLRSIRRQAQAYDEARNESTYPQDEVSGRARGRADDYVRSLFNFSRTEAARPRQYTTYEEVTRPPLLLGATDTPDTTLNGLNYADYVGPSRANDPRSSSPAANLATTRSAFNPYEDLQQRRIEEDDNFRSAMFQAGAAAGRFGAQTIRLSNRALQPRRGATNRGLHDNVTVGLIKARIGAIAGLSYTDNATFQNGPGKRPGLIGQVGIRVNTRQQITKENMLSFQLGAGYTEYLLDPELNNIVRSSGQELDISPTSRIAFETSIGNVFFTLFDSFGVSQRIEDDFLSAQETNFRSIQNTIGMAASWQANRTTSYTASINRSDRKALDTEFSNRDTVAYNFVGDIEYSPGQEWIAGHNQVWIPSGRQSWLVGLSTSISRNERPGETAGPSSSTTIAIGPYFTTAISKFTRIRIGGGIQIAEFMEPGTGTTTSSEPFFSVDVVNRLNRFTNQTLRVGHESGLNDITNAFVADFIQHSFAFNISPRTKLTTTAYLEMQEDRFGADQEDLTRSGINLNMRHRLNPDVTVFLGYNFGKSDSTLIAGTGGSIRDPNDPTLIRNLPGTDITQETFTFDISFPFAREIDMTLGFRRIRTLSSSDTNGNFVENRGSINFSYNF